SVDGASWLPFVRFELLELFGVTGVVFGCALRDVDAPLFPPRGATSLLPPCTLGTPTLPWVLVVVGTGVPAELLELVAAPPPPVPPAPAS
ncbi:MAG: hypothetical protein SGJ19_28080, partial [Planctomycetia bacterium]|nr:hypothetical protein [Planctomycetia bacterium]